MIRSITPIKIILTVDSSHDENLQPKSSYDEPVNTASPMHQIQNVNNSQHHFMYDLLPKPSDGIPISHSVPHMAAFLNGTCNENQSDALVQALFKHIKKYDRSPNMDELRSIVGGLAEQCTNSVSVTDRIELLVRKLCYQFSNQSDRFPVGIKTSSTK